MNENQSINATRRGGGRKPKQYETGRVCKFINCDTSLSTYNKHNFCFVHTPKNFNVRIRPPHLRSLKNRTYVREEKNGK